MLRLVVFVLVAQHLFAADWPQWRGPQRDGHAPGARLEKLPESPRTIWSVKAGLGLASPVVVGKYVILFDAVNGRETLHAVDRESGAEYWKQPVDETFHDMQGPDGPRSTPLVNDGRVYAVSCRGRLVCLQLDDGKEVWSASYTGDFGAEFIGEKGNVPGAGRHGNNGTPLVVGDRLYACAGGKDGASVVCLDKLTGKVIWKSQNDPAAYAPPAFAKLGGVEQVLCFTSDGLIGIAPEVGSLLWRIPIKTAFGRHATAPVWFEDIVIVSSHQAGMIATKVVRDGSTVKAEPAWTSKESAMNFSSPVAKGKYLYGLGPRKNLECVEMTTGKQMWSKDGYFQSSADKAYGGFILVGDGVLCLTDGGLLVLFKADPEKFVELGQTQVCGANWCNPAYADGRLYLRDGNKGPGEWKCVELGGR
jgi:outer membrane protein assembly factor BamB